MLKSEKWRRPVMQPMELTTGQPEPYMCKSYITEIVRKVGRLIIREAQR